MKQATLYTFCAVALFAAALRAAPVTEQDACAAANAFLHNDAIGSAILGDRTVAGIRARHGLWIVSLAPSGHVILAASDRAAPIVGFSANDFADPEPGSPAFALLENAGSAALAREEDDSAVRDTAWDALASAQQTRKRGLLGATAVSSADAGTIIIPPFLTAHFDQMQPYNDFAPVFDPNAANTTYRGRTPAGCVATAAAQLMAHFRWPARIDKTISYDHDNIFWTSDVSATTNRFPVRFDGSTPIDWSAICNTYTNFHKVKEYSEQNPLWWKESPKYDLRGFVDETNRFPIARLMLWADVLANMRFSNHDSTSDYANTLAPELGDWYTTGEQIDMTNTTAPDRIKSLLSAGIPCIVSISRPNSGHQVLLHGWAQNNDKQYAYINFGWSGNSDGFYDISKSFTSAGDNPVDFPTKKVYLGHFPRAKPQLDPLPRICPTNSPLTLAWHFPDIYTNALQSFTVKVVMKTSNPKTYSTDFSDSPGTSSTTLMKVEENSQYGSGRGPLLYIEPLAKGTYSFNDVHLLTSSSKLKFKVNSYACNWSTCEIQANFNDGGWQTLRQLALSELKQVPDGWSGSPTGWIEENIYLGNHGGETARFRIVRERTGTSYSPSAFTLIDDFEVTSVLDETMEDFTTQADERSFTMTPVPGAVCTFTVTPVFSVPVALGGKSVVPEASEPLSLSIEGENKTPLPGPNTPPDTLVIFDSEFATDETGAWQYVGTREDDTVRSDADSPRTSKITFSNLNTSDVNFSTNTVLTFYWSTSQYHNPAYQHTDGQTYDCYDIFQVNYIDENNNRYNIDTSQKLYNESNRVQQTMDISGLANKRGTLEILVTHYGPGYTPAQGGYVKVHAPKLENLARSVEPEIAWTTKTQTALPPPQILSVSDDAGGALAEGFYREAAPGTTRFIVHCSQFVTNLVARSSHLSLVSDEDVTVEQDKPDGGKWSVEVKPSGVNAGNSRSRMILTLIATDSNGVSVSKDLSLRFELATYDPAAPKPVVAAQDAAAAEAEAAANYVVALPQCVKEGADGAAYRRFFKPVAKPVDTTGSSGDQFEISFELADDEDNTLQNQVDKGSEDAISGDSITIEGIPGLWYWLETADSLEQGLTIRDTANVKRATSQYKTMTFPTDKTNPSQFYRVRISAEQPTQTSTTTP